MSICVKIKIPFTPKAKSSWKLGKYGKYNPSAKGMSKTAQFVAKELQKSGHSFPLPGPLLVIVHYRIPAPRKILERKRQLQNSLPHNKRPDADNLDKFLNDALNGVLWKDDSAIVWLLRSKSITSAKEGETILYVRELGNTAPDYQQLVTDIREHINFEQSND